MIVELIVLARHSMMMPRVDAGQCVQDSCSCSAAYTLDLLTISENKYCIYTQYGFSTNPRLTRHI